jgi:hypothetical protein
MRNIQSKKKNCHTLRGHRQKHLLISNKPNVWLRSEMFYDNAINRLFWKKLICYRCIQVDQKTGPWGSVLVAKPIIVLFFCSLAPQKYDMSISQTGWDRNIHLSFFGGALLINGIFFLYFFRRFIYNFFSWQWPCTFFEVLPDSPMQTERAWNCLLF